MSRTFKVIFQPAGRRGEIEEGTTILKAAQLLGVDLEALCGDKKVCGKCKVRIEEGYFEKDNMESGMAHITPSEPTADEIEASQAGRRSRCEARLFVRDPRRPQGFCP